MDLQLKIKRKIFKNAYTIGRWSADGVDMGCDSLEDTRRFLNQGGTKIAGKTAIPAGTYEVIMSYSPRFRREMPEIIGVPQFTGLRIHSFNESKETEGCLAGGIHNPNYNGGDWISNSKYWTGIIEARIVEAIGNGDKVFLTIEN